MKLSENNGYHKRTQKDYSLSFKLQLVEEIEHGLLTKSQATTKYGIQGDSTVSKWLTLTGNTNPLNVCQKPQNKKYLN